MCRRWRAPACAPGLPPRPPHPVPASSVCPGTCTRFRGGRSEGVRPHNCGRDRWCTGIQLTRIAARYAKPGGCPSQQKASRGQAAQGPPCALPVLTSSKSTLYRLSHSCWGPPVSVQCPRSSPRPLALPGAVPQAVACGCELIRRCWCEQRLHWRADLPCQTAAAAAPPARSAASALLPRGRCQACSAICCCMIRSIES